MLVQQHGFPPTLPSPSGRNAIRATAPVFPLPWGNPGGDLSLELSPTSVLS